MADIAKIKLPSGTEYDIKDAWARQQIEALVGGSAVIFRGVSSTALTDGGTEKPTIGGEVINDVVTGNLVFYGTDEFIWGTNGAWSELGPTLTILGDLAYADTASASYTPAGSVSFTNTNKTATVAPAASGTATYTPAGTITGAAFTGASMTSTGTFTPSGDVTSTFTGASMTSTGSFTPSGSVSLTTENKTATVSKAASGTATYTPEGSVAAPTISVATAGSTTTIKNPTKQTVATGLAVAAPGATAPANAQIYYSVANETLSLYQIGYNTGDSITTTDVTVKTGDAAYEATAPAFTGTGARLVTGNIAVPTSASFTGSSGSVSVSGTTAGSVSSTFEGDSGNVSVSGTTTGSVSQGTFTGTGVRLETGDISVPSSASFSGTQATITVTPDS